ncbi:hypothetical protein ONS96_005980 [Cadophora gregata f. sp. sojae]|nr:hypothetical protein ONS96_005980 [Cadophora gregata f. sp. sojae]
MATTFTLFPNLATELQDLIWEAAATSREPRTFDIRFRRGKNPHDGPVRVNAKWATSEDNPGPLSPAMFSVCKRSREIAKKYSKLAFGGMNNNPVWFDFQTDIVVCQNTVKFMMYGSCYAGMRSCCIANEASVLQDFAQVKNFTCKTYYCPAEWGPHYVGAF